MLKIFQGSRRYIVTGQRRQIHHKKSVLSDDQMAVREFPVTITSPLAGWTDRQSFTAALGAIDGCGQTDIIPDNFRQICSVSCLHINLQVWTQLVITERKIL